MKKKCTELVFTLNKHSMALAFRIGTPKAKSAFIEQSSGSQPQSVKETLDNLKRAVHGLKDSTHGLVMEFAALSQATRINSGKLLDVNVIARQVLDESIHSHSTGGGTGEDKKADSANQGSLS